MLNFPVISLHPCFEADLNLLLGDKSLSSSQKDLIKKARAVILPQGCKADVYWYCRQYCHHVFPNYDYRFPGEGKVGDALLWKSLRLPHPRTIIYPEVNYFYKLHFEMGNALPFTYPFVVKGDRGGEGNMVFLIKDEGDLKQTLDLLFSLEKNQGWHGFILQEFIAHQNKDLRVVVIGTQRFFYWRMKDGSDWRSNLAQGGEIDTNVSSDVKAKVGPYIDTLCQKTGINLAAIDVLCPQGTQPLLLEINYYFGRKALGGSDSFYELLGKEVEKWLKTIKGH